MSITFLQEPNGYKEIADVWWLGETVTLDTTTRVFYLYFEAYWGMDRNPIHCDVYLTDEDHHPVGSPIVTVKDWIKAWQKHGVRRRVCFVFWGFPMEAGIEYFFLFRDDSPTWHINTRIYCRLGDSIYEGGMLYYSDNSGGSWIEYPNDDIVFALTGTPEVPPPPPPAPVDKFAILDLEQTATTTGMKIVVTTSVPCHLYFYWTDHEPQKHLIPILRRGLELHTQLQYCFVSWHENEQEEPLDTLTHTFIKEPWAECETRWLTFRAKVMNEWVKSVGPIFKKHRVVPPYGPPVTVKFYSDPHPEVTSVDGYAMQDTHLSTWAFLRNGPGNFSNDTLARLYIGYLSANVADFWWDIIRAIQLFDTSSIPVGSSIDSAKISAKTIILINDLGGSPAFNIFSSNPASNIALTGTDYATCGSVKFSNDVSFGDLVVGTWQDYPFNAAGLAAITPGGISKFSVREVNYDLVNMPPPWGGSQKSDRYAFQSAEAAAANRPYLEVTYREAL